jgi:hypothetical protein
VPPPSVLALSPFESPDHRVVIAAARAGALAVLDLGRDHDRARNALYHIAAEPRYQFGVRIPEGVRFDAASLPQNVATVVLAAGQDLSPWSDYQRIVQVTSVEQAIAACDAGADAIIAKGTEAGGRVGSETAFVLLQQLIRHELSVPIWVQGGIGEYTAALHGHRVFSRPDLKLAELTAEELTQRLGAGGLDRHVIPAGADAAFAAGLAERYGSVGRLVGALASRTSWSSPPARRCSMPSPPSRRTTGRGRRSPRGR